MTMKFWMFIGISKIIRHPRWHYFVPVNSTGRGVPHSRSPVAYICCVRVLYPCNARIEPTTLQPIDDTCTFRYYSTTATGWLYTFIYSVDLIYSYTGYHLPRLSHMHSKSYIFIYRLPFTHVITYAQSILYIHIPVTIYPGYHIPSQYFSELQMRSSVDWAILIPTFLGLELFQKSHLTRVISRLADPSGEFRTPQSV